MSKFTRQDFINLGKSVLALTGLAVIFGPIVAFFYPANLEETPSEPVLVCPQDELKEGESKTIRFGRYPAIVINTTEGLRAYSAVCTHFACIVKWNPEDYEIECPCHEGYFDPFNGAVVSGPPPTPLEALVVEIIDGDIYVGGAA
ncbi:MAG: ubiquinol-cytochrome c reductase iron-sulfur subunit [Anaerolineales bacterium]|jgi:cytochrome b6-f complex iron-sulfur subunit